MCHAICTLYHVKETREITVKRVCKYIRLVILHKCPLISNLLRTQFFNYLMHVQNHNHYCPSTQVVPFSTRSILKESRTDPLTFS